MPRPTPMPMMRGAASRISSAAAPAAGFMLRAEGVSDKKEKAGFGGRAMAMDMAANESFARSDLMSLQSAKVVGKDAVQRNKRMDEFKLATNVLSDSDSAMPVKNIDGKTFYLRDGFWTDASFDGRQKPTAIEFGSKEYFELLKKNAGIGKYLAAGRQLVLVYNGNCYRIKYN